MNLTTITNQLRNFAHDELLTLANWCQAEADRKVSEIQQKEAENGQAKRELEQADRDAKTNRLVTALKKVLKPGVTLKMKGCKDGAGIREFIRWDNSNNLVCWQIRRRRLPRGWEDTKTNQVTTHMPDKVQEIYVDGTALQIKSILK